MKETNNVEQRPRTSLSKGARRNQILRRITVVGVIAAVITAAFAGYCLHRERVEEKQKAEELRKEKQDKKEEKETVKVTDLDESTITAIKYQVAAGEMSFEKEGDTWYYSEDKDFPLKQSEPEAIVKAAAQITADRKLEDGDSLDWMTRIIPLRSRKKTEQ